MTISFVGSDTAEANASTDTTVPNEISSGALSSHEMDPPSSLRNVIETNPAFSSNTI